MWAVLAAVGLIVGALLVDALLRRWESRRSSDPAPASPLALLPYTERITDSAGCRVFEGALYHAAHFWVTQEGAGCVRVGLDDLAHGTLGAIASWECAPAKDSLTQGASELIFRTSWGDVALPAPVDGRILERSSRPNEWLLVIRLPEQADCLRNLIPGDGARGWMRDEVTRLNELLDPEAPASRTWGLPDLDSVGPTQRSMLATMLLRAQAVQEVRS